MKSFSIILDLKKTALNETIHSNINQDQYSNFADEFLCSNITPINSLSLRDGGLWVESCIFSNGELKGPASPSAVSSIDFLLLRDICSHS